MTPAQDALLARLVDILDQDPRVTAVWLSGSLGKGEGDAWSDVDLVARVSADDVRACVADYKGARAGWPETVLAFDVYGVVVSAITPEWERFDIHFASPENLARMDTSAWKPLLGEATVAPAAAAPADAGAAGRVSAIVTEFLRVLGLLPVAVGREEWIVSQQGFELLRRMLADLMLEENGVGGAARGVKRLNAFLTPAQRTELEGLVAPAAERAALIAANAEIARAFLERARPLAERLGVTWPDAFEAATRRHLESMVGLRI